MDDNKNKSVQDPPPAPMQDSTPQTTQNSVTDAPPTITQEQPMTTDLPPTPTDVPEADQTPTPNAPITSPDTAPSNQNHIASSGTNNKKTVAIAAAGISAILVILGVYAMTRENFKTNTNQYAAPNNATSGSQAAKKPTVTPKEVSSDPVDKSLDAVDLELKKADADTKTIDQTLQATPDPLN
jgi:hypothetical protein